MNNFQIGQEVYVFDPNRGSVYECRVKDKICGDDGEVFVYILTPTNQNLTEVKLSKNHVHKTFREAFTESVMC